MSPTLADSGHGYLLERDSPAIGSRPLLVILAEYTDDGTGEWPSIASLHPPEYYDDLAFGTPTPPFSTSDPVNPDVFIGADTDLNRPLADTQGSEEFPDWGSHPLANAKA